MYMKAYGFDRKQVRERRRNRRQLETICPYLLQGVSSSIFNGNVKQRAVTANLELTTSY
jgi:hypothetical protein